MKYEGINMVQDMANYIKKLTVENEKLKEENKKLKEDNEQLNVDVYNMYNDAQYWKDKYYKLSRGESTRITCIFKEEE